MCCVINVGLAWPDGRDGRGGCGPGYGFGRECVMRDERYSKKDKLAPRGVSADGLGRVGGSDGREGRSGELDL